MTAMLRIKPEVHARAALAAELAGNSLNRWGEEALLAAVDPDQAQSDDGR